MKKFLVYGLTINWGGVEAIVLSMIKRLSCSYSFDIILSPEDCPYSHQYKADNISFVHIPSWGSDRKGFADGLKKLYSVKNYDYLWINGCLMSNKTVISVTKKYSRAKIITHSHGSSFEEKNFVKKLILLFLHKLNRPYYLKNLDYPCMCAHKSGEWFYGKSYLKEHKVHWIKNGVDVSRFQFDIEKRNAIRNELGIKNDTFALFHVGRLTAVKNQQKLLSVFADFVSTGVNTRLFIAGEGELKEELIRQSQQLEVADLVTFMGLRKDVNDLYQAMDVMLLPSFHEGFPVTLVEAQASGLPCIVSDNVTRETDVVGIIDYLSIEGDNKEWVECLTKIHSNPNPNRQKYSLLMREARYDIDSVCSDFVSFISK